VTQPSVQEQIQTIRSGAVDLITEKELEAKLTHSLKAKKPLRIKYGADPSSPDLHLGHTVPLRKLRQFQELGHQVVFIIGDFTARIGDPSGASVTRPMLSPNEIRQNAETYQQQVFRILNPDKTEVRYNSEWLEGMSTTHFLDLTSRYTVARLLERDDFQKRYRSAEPIALVEFLYPLLQGYDSVMVRSDMEIGGTDQKFNLLVGRDLQREWKLEAQIVLTLPLLEGTDGVQKMSKSFGNHIALKDSPKEMYGKVMSLPDALMERYYRLVSPLPADEVENLLKKLASGEFHPRAGKAKLAFEIVKEYHSKKEAEEAALEFDRIFREKGLPDEIETVRLKEREMDILTLLKETGLVPSKMEARRLVEIVLGIEPRCLVVPAHAWTPHFAIFGSNSGFDSVEECFEHQAKNIFVLETGLSSDPAMNWRLSTLDRYALISNSDSHSARRIGREANVFNCELDYSELVTALKTKDASKFLYTVEFFPEEGKYHFDGHRKCNLRLSPKETKQQGFRCPVCGRPVTVGVMHRVEKLADRPEGAKPATAIPYKHIVPLEEIIADALEVGVGTQAVDREYFALVDRFGTEFGVLLKTSEEELRRAAPARIVDGIIHMRQGQVTVDPGYDGEYGKVHLFGEAQPLVPNEQQMTLF